MLCANHALIVAMCLWIFGFMRLPDATAAPSRIQFSGSGQLLGGNDLSADVALGDVDGDGDPDALIAKPATNSQVWLNQGGRQAGSAGTFLDSGRLLPVGIYQSVALVDLDSDRDLDAFFLEDGASANASEIWMNQGSSEAEVWRGFVRSQAITANGVAVAFGELDDRPGPDAFIVRGSLGRANQVWLNDGNGSLTESGQNLGNAELWDLALADVDGDEDLDAFTVGRRAHKLWLNQGGAQRGAAGTFLESSQVLIDTGAESTSVALGDLDGDGDIDAFVAGIVSDVWMNQGGRQGGAQGFFLKNGQQHASGNDIAWDVALGDLDKDGDLDAFVVRNGSHRVYDNPGSGLFFDSDLRLQAGFNMAVVLGDLDGDSDLDAFVGRNLQPNHIWLNQTPPPPAPGYHSRPMPGHHFDFGWVETDDTSLSAELTIQNTGRDSLVIQSISLAGLTSNLMIDLTSSFPLVPLTFPYRIGPASSTSVVVTVKISLVPKTTGDFNNTLRVETNDPKAPRVDYPISYFISRDLDETLEEAILVLFRVPFAEPPTSSVSRLTVRAAGMPAQPQRVLFRLDPTAPHSLSSEIPPFLGGGSVQLSNFTGSVAVSLYPMPNDPGRAILQIDSGSFTAPSFFLPSGLATGPNKLTFDSASKSEGVFQWTGEYTVSAAAAIVNDLFPEGIPVRGRYQGRYDPTTERVTVQSQSTDYFKVEDGLKFARSGKNAWLTWMSGLLEESLNVRGPWTLLTNAASPRLIEASFNQHQFFRLQPSHPDRL
ncbi:MAG: FG-GAP-like repeat-containing protein, partial [Verrucomicrobiales bacterium]|nr:FG-GAP-like repeat-containing protein [Verrucomicrobiales bacterium]